MRSEGSGDRSGVGKGRRTPGTGRNSNGSGRIEPESKRHSDQVPRSGVRSGATGGENASGAAKATQRSERQRSEHRSNFHGERGRKRDYHPHNHERRREKHVGGGGDNGVIKPTLLSPAPPSGSGLDEHQMQLSQSSFRSSPGEKACETTSPSARAFKNTESTSVNIRTPWGVRGSD